MDNLLNNGMEACSGVIGEKEISLVVRAQDDRLEIYLENSIGESVVRNNPVRISRKEEKERYGFGMVPGSGGFPCSLTFRKICDKLIQDVYLRKRGCWRIADYLRNEYLLRYTKCHKYHRKGVTAQHE